jgi:hypothetical protein
MSTDDISSANNGRGSRGTMRRRLVTANRDFSSMLDQTS